MSDPGTTDREAVAAPGELREDLGDGLLLRSATPADADALAAFNGGVHRDDGAAGPDEMIAAWTRDLLLRPHPTFRPELFTVVEDTASGKIASTLNLIPQTWTYGGVGLGVGRIELVGTDPAYRRRGLVRRQMAVAHAWSAAMGHAMQGITGIPWYYRQFGYEMALSLDASRRLTLDRVEALPEGTPEPFIVRPATPDDLPFIAATDAHGRERSLVACARDDALWRYELDGRSGENQIGRALAVIERGAEPGDAPAERRVGYLAHGAKLWGTALFLTAYELAPGAAWTAVTPSVLRHLKALAESWAAAPPAEGTPAPAPFAAIVLMLETEHPAYAVLGARARQERKPYAWFVRVPDVPAFLRRVAPVLEARLAASPAAGHDGDLTLWFYGRGVRLTLTRGKVAAVEPWQDPGYTASAAFPGLTFLQLLVGHRSLADLEDAFPDLRVRSELDRLLLDALFPRQASSVWPVS